VSARIICQSERLVLRELSADEPGDVTFIRALVNDPGWLQFIGDRHVHDEVSGKAYVAKMAASYAEHGFGFWAVCPKAADGSAGPPVGICGLIKRATLAAVDLGFAFLSAGRGQGQAREAAQATLAHARTALGLTELLAITDPANARSIHLLESLGFALQRRAQLDPADIELSIFHRAL
jgi:ribosomal-protein-alanine N-acetyltransferase